MAEETTLAKIKDEAGWTVLFGVTKRRCTQQLREEDGKPVFFNTEEEAKACAKKVASACGHARWVRRERKG
ncbi:MAG TPA: hypothetical protein VMY35_07585 [Phycisphaerae bacterium]|nr:hypothetical protein [Phycisphaerae bacterium]